METIDNILEDIMIVRTHEDVINFRGSLYNAARQWWAAKSEKVKQANYVMVGVDNYVREIYKPKNTLMENGGFSEYKMIMMMENTAKVCLLQTHSGKSM